MGFKARIFVKIKLNYFVLHFRQISLMKCDEFNLYCLHYQKYSNIKDLSEEIKERILETKALKEEVKEEKQFAVFQHFGNAVLKCHGINIDPCCKRYV